PARRRTCKRDDRWRDRSIQDARHSVEPSGKTTPRPCSELVLRNPSWSAVSVTAHKTGRTYGRKRSGPSIDLRSCKSGAVHIWVPACAGMTREGCTRRKREEGMEKLLGTRWRYHLLFLFALLVIPRLAVAQAPDCDRPATGP